MSSASASFDIPVSPILPWWHTVLLLALFATGSVASAYQHSLPNANLPGLSQRLSSYFTVLAEEWLAVLLIWLPLRRQNLALNSLIRGSWRSLGSFFKDLGIALGFLVIIIPLGSGLAYLLGANKNPALANLVPKTGVQLVVSLALAATAGFAEELVFRGYLTRQFSAWTGKVSFGILLQGVAFGLAHGFYGKAMAAIMVYGWLLGLLAYWRKSLRPGMLAHWLQDTIANVAAFLS